MRDFDQERAERATLDHTFKIAGTEFRFRPAVRPETFAKVADLLLGTYRDSFPIPEARAEDGEPLTVYRMPNEEEAVGVLHDLFLEYLEPESHGDWERVRADTDDPITAAEMWDLMGYMQSVQNGRPTLPASDSSSGAGSNGAK